MSQQVSVQIIGKNEIPSFLGKWKGLYEAMKDLPTEKALKVSLPNEKDVKTAISAVHRFKRNHLPNRDFTCTSNGTVVYVERTK